MLFAKDNWPWYAVILYIIIRESINYFRKRPEILANLEDQKVEREIKLSEFVNSLMKRMTILHAAQEAASKQREAELVARIKTLEDENDMDRKRHNLKLQRLRDAGFPIDDLKYITPNPEAKK